MPHGQGTFSTGSEQVLPKRTPSTRKGKPQIHTTGRQTQSEIKTPTFIVSVSVSLIVLELVLGEMLLEVGLLSSSSFSLFPQPRGDSEVAQDVSRCRFRPKKGKAYLCTSDIMKSPDSNFLGVYLHLHE